MFYRTGAKRAGLRRPRRALVVLALMALLLSSCGGSDLLSSLGLRATDTPAPTATPDFTATPIPTPTSTFTPSPTATETQTPTPSATPTITDTPTVTPTPSLTPTATVVPVRLDRTENILILGTDQRPGDRAWRTDTVMVAVVDYSLGQVAVISIPRDLLVEIPGYGEARINQADFLGEVNRYPGGGPKLVGKILDDLLGIPTQHYVRLTYDGLPRLVDALGGVTVHLDCPLFEQTPDPEDPNRVLDWSLPAGDVLLDGNTAKKFVTYRYLTTDFGRVRRQQQLIWAIRDRALQLDIIPKIPELWRALSDVFVTDLTLLDVIRLARLGVTLGPDKVRGIVFGPEVMSDYVTPEGAWVLMIKDRARLEQMKANLFNSQPLAELEHNGADGGCKPPPPGYTAPQPMPTPAAKAP